MKSPQEQAGQTHQQDRHTRNIEQGFFEAEKIHETLFREALASLSTEMKTLEYYVCPVCGYVHLGAAPEKCPVCSTPGARFERID